MADSFMQTEMLIRGIGLTTELREPASTTTLMELFTMESGSMISNVERERKFGQTGQSTRENLKTAKKMEMANFNGLMVLDIKALFKTTVLRDMANTLGRMAGSTRGNGKIIKCTGKEFSLGQMVSIMLATMPMTRRKVTDSLLGLTGGNTLGIGKTGNNMGKELCLIKKARKRNVNGMRGNEWI